MIEAKRARKIASSELLQIMHKIEECAYKGGFEIILEFKISQEVTSILNNYGYLVEYEQVPIYEETPYGVRYNIIGYKDQTTINWYA